jgi:hypothetical protein
VKEFSCVIDAQPAEVEEYRATAGCQPHRTTPRAYEDIFSPSLRSTSVHDAPRPLKTYGISAPCVAPRVG